MTELRDYQQDLLAQVQAALADPSARVMLQLPTGGGKTRIAAALLHWWLSDGGKAVWITHRSELSDQTCQVLNNSGVRAANSLPWDIDRPAPTWDGGIVILMADTVGRRNQRDGVWDRYSDSDLLIIDEAHHAPAASWKRAIDQWPGPVVGLTATPWRLSKTEGFDHLFSELILGPQINELQGQGHLANARVLMPESEDLIVGGTLLTAGDYTLGGIESANRGRNIWTAGAIHFWQEYAQNRQTIVYAVSVEHAENLTAVFGEAGVSAAMLLSYTPLSERAERIKRFSDGTLNVLVNVAVATEGFDLPDASCVVLTRPTLSLALYLQMVGRGLRPKSDQGNCLILDLAGNVERHGFPEDNREWSLKARGSQGPDGSAPVVRCPDCAGVSPAASHHCRDCGSPLGKDCERCGKWRAWKSWSAETYCGDAHDLVCNYCHSDAHELPQGLKAMLRKESEGYQPKVNPASLDTLEEVRQHIYEVSEDLVHLMRTDDKAASMVGDSHPFNVLTRQLRSLLSREAKLKRDREEEFNSKLGELLAPDIIPIIEELAESYREMGMDLTSVAFDYDYRVDKVVRFDVKCLKDGQRFSPNPPKG